MAGKKEDDSPKVTVKPTARQERLEWADTVNDNAQAIWARDTKKRIEHRSRQGYQIAKPEEIRDHSGTVGDDGAIRMGDRVLMIGDKKAAEERQAERHAELQQMAQSRERETTGEGFYRSDGHGQRRGNRFISIP